MSEQMINQLTNIHLIKNNLQANNKKELFEELAQMLLENNRINNKEAFLTDLEAREAMSVTSMVLRTHIQKAKRSQSQPSRLALNVMGLIMAMKRESSPLYFS